jgi:hypothetical protein
VTRLRRRYKESLLESYYTRGRKVVSEAMRLRRRYEELMRRRCRKRCVCAATIRSSVILLLCVLTVCESLEAGVLQLKRTVPEIRS